MKMVQLEVTVVVADHYDPGTVADVVDEAIQEKVRWWKDVKVAKEGALDGEVRA